MKTELEKAISDFLESKGYCVRVCHIHGEDVKALGCEFVTVNLNLSIRATTNDRLKGIYFYLVDKEKEVEPTHILLKCPHCSRDYQSKI